MTQYNPFWLRLSDDHREEVDFHFFIAAPPRK